jgi:hypothetical protein
VGGRGGPSRGLLPRRIFSTFPSSVLYAQKKGPSFLGPSLPRAELELRHAGFKSWEGAPSRERPIDQDGAYGPEAGPTER